ncbi:MAG TPA: archaellin/type IV pilin N-terminal domain-containing protein [Candidatus Nanoarchaeia archaeon]|nr:archaellin/type IV pilin N-terminal domain-containing protein [Candidatus Nanoarchaeia archaeon]
MNKRAASEIISWILLVGMTIALATIVSIWIKSTVEKDVKDIVDPINEDMLCNDISFNVNLTNDCSNPKISNKGSFTIDDFIIRINDEMIVNGNRNIWDESIIPGQTKVLNSILDTIPGDEIEFIPISRNSTCSSRSVKVIC